MPKFHETRMLTHEAYETHKEPPKKAGQAMSYVIFLLNLARGQVSATALTLDTRQGCRSRR